MNMSSVVTPDVAEALQELEGAYPGKVAVEPDETGGAYVTIEEFQLGPSWSQSEALLIFHLPFNYPAASPYPYYLPGNLQLRGDWPVALQRIRWRDREVIQVSLRHNHWDPRRDRVLGCILQVREWLCL